MAQMPLALIARPAQKEALLALCDRLEIAGVLNPTRSNLSGLPAPVFTDMGDLHRQVSPAVCCFLTPYADLKRDLFDCLERRVHVLSAGPLSLSRGEFDGAVQAAREGGVHLRIGGRYLFSPLYRTLLERRQAPAFGNPVYLRHVTGGGDGLLPAWWAACEALDQAGGLLGAALRNLHVAARREGRKYHLTLTASMANRANAQLVVAPVHLPISSDLTLLGSGGLLFADSVSHASTVIKPGGVRLHPNVNLYPDAAWLEDFLGRLDGPEPQASDGFTVQNAVLRSIRQAARRQAPVRVKLPR